MTRFVNSFQTAVTLALVAIGAAIPSGAAHAYSLLEAWEAALKADPAFQGAYYEREVGRYNEPLAKSQLLPNISLSTADSKVKGDRSSLDLTSGLSGDIPLAYTSSSRSLNLRVPLYSPEGLARWRQGKAQSTYADDLYVVRGKDLANRVSAAYLDVLLAIEILAQAEEQVGVYRNQERVAQRRFAGGEGTRTEVAETQARADLAAVQVIEARDQLSVARRVLTNITGRDSASVTRGGALRVAVTVQPASLETWFEQAVAANPEIRARRQSVEIARLEVERARSGHLPRVDLVGSVSKTKNDTVNTLNTQFNLRSLGVQVTIPIYQGGYVDLLTSQAIASLEKSRLEVEQEVNAQRTEVSRAYFSAISGLAKMEAQTRALQSSELALEGARAGMRTGFRSMLDVLDGERQLYQARRDLAQTRFTFLAAYSRLKLIAGQPFEEVMSQLEAVLP
jgi:protease secretion system outer membrane protein